MTVKSIHTHFKLKKNKKNEGPYILSQVYCNGTIRMQKGSIYEHIKIIRRLTPYLRDYKVKLRTKTSNKKKKKIYSIQYNKFNLKQTLRLDVSTSAIKPYMIP